MNNDKLDLIAESILYVKKIWIKKCMTISTIYMMLWWMFLLQ
jgi:hypothetical protein